VPFVVEAGTARLTLLRGDDGGFHTVYGYPHPVGQISEEDLAALASALCQLDAPLRIALSPLGSGAALARHLAGKLTITSRRPICVADLDGDPLERFAAKAQAKVRRAVKQGVVAEVSPVTRDFGMLYRGAMDVLGADQLYCFDDAYFSALAEAGAFQVTASDDHGICASALFLVGGSESSYHLSARRTDPVPAPGAVNLVVLTGLRECARRNASHCILGGGTTGEEDDPLLKFKAGMATRTLIRPTFERGPG